MNLTKNLKLFGIVFFMLLGLWLLFLGYDSNQKVSNYSTDSNKITVIDLSNDKTSQHKYTFAGIILISISLFLTANFYLSNKTPVINTRKELTDQEEKISNLILQGMTNKEIAQNLSISVSTVKTHINNIYKKFGVKSRPQYIQMTQNKRV